MTLFRYDFPDFIERIKDLPHGGDVADNRADLGGSEKSVARFQGSYPGATTRQPCIR